MTGIWSSASALLAHIPSTLATAGAGYLLGNGIGVLVAYAFARNQFVRRILWPVMTLAFVTPLIMLAPLLGTVFGQSRGAMLLVCVSVYYTTATLVLSALDALDEGFGRVVKAAGGTEHDVHLRVWTPAALPALMAALRAGIPAALLAAIIGDLFGAEKGLGVRLVAIMLSGDTAGILAFCIVCAGLAWSGLGAISLLERGLPRRFRITLSPPDSHQRGRRLSDQAPLRRYGEALSALVAAIVLWALLAAVIDVRAYFKGPLDLVTFAIRQPGGFWTELAVSGGWTLIRAAAGVLAALVFATMTAIIANVWPKTRYVALVPVLITQTVPLVALVPLIVAAVGKGSPAVVLVTFAATFFLMFSAVDAGLRATPTTYRLMTRLYGVGFLRHVLMVAIPSSRPYIAAGIALTVPRMMAGAILAEYLVSADGIGWMVYRYRAHQFATVWLLGLLSGVAAMQIGRQVDRVAEWLWYEATLVEVRPRKAGPSEVPA